MFCSNGKDRHAVSRLLFDRCCEGKATRCATSTCTSRARDAAHPRQPGSPRKYCAFLSDRQIGGSFTQPPTRQALLRNTYGVPDLSGVPVVHFNRARRWSPGSGQFAIRRFILPPGPDA